MTSKQKTFADSIAKYVKKYAPKYGISVYSPIIAQAILESGWGTTKLAKYHNYFGMKCGSSWKGKSVNITTQEEFTKGTMTTIKDNFRVFDSMEDGVKGYFDFISTKRYSNLRGITSPKAYLQTIKNDGYATNSNYVTLVYKCVTGYNLTSYDPVKSKNKTGTVTASKLNVREGAGTNYNIKITISKGKSVEILDSTLDKTNDVWYHIKVDSIYGFVCSKYIEVK